MRKAWILTIVIVLVAACEPSPSAINDKVTEKPPDLKPTSTAAPSSTPTPSATSTQIPSPTSTLTSTPLPARLAYQVSNFFNPSDFTSPPICDFSKPFFTEAKGDVQEVYAGAFTWKSTYTPLGPDSGTYTIHLVSWVDLCKCNRTTDESGTYKLEFFGPPGELGSQVMIHLTISEYSSCDSYICYDTSTGNDGMSLQTVPGEVCP